jgi:hypothetical protein
MFKRLYLMILRDLYAGMAMSSLMQSDISAARGIAKEKPGETVGQYLARRSFDHADNLIQHRSDQQRR